MKTNRVAVAALIAAVAAPAAFAQEAVQWRVEDGGNGHWYRVVAAGSVTVADAFSLAESFGGYAATIATPEENAFCCAVADPHVVLIGVQKEKGTNAGGWITGEAWTFAGWWYDAPWWNGEDNNSWELHALLHPEWPDCSWQDIMGSSLIDAVLVEFSADCNGDGIVDYGQILDGTFEDADGNGVPDCCDEGLTCNPCPGDVNNDGQVNGADISVLLGFWGLNGKPVAADINKDGQVDGTDLANVLGSWGECP